MQRDLPRGPDDGMPQPGHSTSGRVPPPGCASLTRTTRPHWRWHACVAGMPTSTPPPLRAQPVSMTRASSGMRAGGAHARRPTPVGEVPGRAAAAGSEPVLDTEAQQLDVLELDAVVALVPVVVPVGEGVGGVDQVEVEVAGEIGANAHAEIGAVGIGLVRAGLDVAVEVAAAGDAIPAAVMAEADARDRADVAVLELAHVQVQATVAGAIQAADAAF